MSCYWNFQYFKRKTFTNTMAMSCSHCMPWLLSFVQIWTYGILFCNWIWSEEFFFVFKISCFLAKKNFSCLFTNEMTMVWITVCLDCCHLFKSGHKIVFCDLSWFYHRASYMKWNWKVTSELIGKSPKCHQINWNFKKRHLKYVICKFFFLYGQKSYNEMTMV